MQLHSNTMGRKTILKMKNDKIIIIIVHSDDFR